MTRQESEVLLDHIGAQAFESPELRDLRFKDARRKHLEEICMIYDLPVQPGTHKLRGQDDRISGLVPKMTAWLEEGKFDKVAMGENGPMTIAEYRMLSSAPDKPKDDKKAA